MYNAEGAHDERSGKDEITVSVGMQRYVIGMNHRSDKRRGADLRGQPVAQKTIRELSAGSSATVSGDFRSGTTFP